MFEFCAVGSVQCPLLCNRMYLRRSLGQNRRMLLRRDDDRETYIDMQSIEVDGSGNSVT